jgi:hypothetical protein
MSTELAKRAARVRQDAKRGPPISIRLCQSDLALLDAWASRTCGVEHRAALVAGILRAVLRIQVFTNPHQQVQWMPFSSEEVPF